MGKLIAVVEDEPFIAEVLEFLLAGVDRQVKLLRSGEEARRYFSHSQLTGEETPALVVLDLMMPDDDGEAIYESMLKPGSGWIAGRPKTIVLSAVGQAPVKERLLKLGVDQFITKPFSNEELLAEVDRLCG